MANEIVLCDQAVHHAGEAKGGRFEQVVLDQLDNMSSTHLGLASLGHGFVRVGRQANFPNVLAGSCLMNVLAHLCALGLVKQDLGLGLGGGCHARNLEFRTEAGLVWDLVI